MNKTKRSGGGAGLVLCGTLAVVLTGCTTYMEPRPVHTVYVSPPVAPPPAVVVTPPAVVTPVESSVAVIQTESDFYEPLGAHGEWVVVGSYGPCWRPTRVEVGWRPYGDGHWRRTDAGWYWVSDEPWGWATYHYGRWDWSVDFGWFWLPHTQWAPAWVSWRQGGGYVGWAPLPPSARIGALGIVEVQERAITPRAFVFVSEQRLLERVRPTTVVANNTTVINQTVNITKIQVVNKSVINEGPQPEIIERKSGRKVEAVPVRELRYNEETEVAARRRNIASPNGKTVQAAARTATAPPNTIPARERRPAVNPAESTTGQTLPARAELRKPTELNPAPNATRPEVARLVRNDVKPEIRNEKGTSETVSTNAQGRGRQGSKPSVVLPSEKRAAPEATLQRQAPSAKSEIRGANELKRSETPARSEAADKPVVNARHRELERSKPKPETVRPVTGRNPATPPASKQVEKPATPEKPSVRKRGEAKKKADDQKKGEAQETLRPGTPPRSPS